MNILTLKHWNIGTLEHWNIGTLLHWNIETFKCSNVQMLKWSNLQISKYSNVQMFKCSNVKMFKCSNGWSLPSLITLTPRHSPGRDRGRGGCAPAMKKGAPAIKKEQLLIISISIIFWVWKRWFNLWMNLIKGQRTPWIDSFHFVSVFVPTPQNWLWVLLLICQSWNSSN